MEEAKKNRLLISQVDTKEAYERKQLESMKKQKPKKVTQEPAEKKGTTIKPETTRQTETGFQVDVQESEVTHQGVKTQEVQVSTEQKRQGRESHKKLSNTVETLATKQEKWVQEKIIEPAKETASKKLQASQEAKNQGRNLEAGVGMAGYMLTNVAIGTIDELTTPLRPRKIQKDIQVTKDIIHDTPVQVKSDQLHGHTETQKMGTREVVKSSIIADPVAFTGQVAGSFLGGAIVGDIGTRLYDKATGTETIKVTQIDELKIRDTTPGPGKPGIELEISPKISTKTRRVQVGNYDEALDIKPDTIYGTVEGQGYVLSLGKNQVDELLTGKKIRVSQAKGELVPVPDDFKPVVGIETLKPNSLKDSPGIQKVVSTTATQEFKELGSGSLFPGTPPQGKVTAEAPVTMKVIGLGETLDDTPGFQTVTRTPGKTTPWDYQDQVKAVQGTQRILKEGPPEPPTSKGPGLKIETPLVKTGGSKIVTKTRKSSYLGVPGVGGEPVTWFSETRLQQRLGQDQVVKQEDIQGQGRASLNQFGISFDLNSWVRPHSITGGYNPPVEVPQVIPDVTTKETPEQGPIQSQPPTQEVVNSQGQGFFLPSFTGYQGSRKGPGFPGEKETRKKRMGFKPLVGFEERQYRLIKPGDILKGKLKI